MILKIPSNNFIFNNEIEINSGGKSNISIFAPNGCGKTTIFNSLKNGDSKIDGAKISDNSVFLNEEIINDLLLNEIYIIIMKNSNSFSKFEKKEKELNDKIIQITECDNFQISHVKDILENTNINQDILVNKITNMKDFIKCIDNDIKDMTISSFKKILDDVSVLNFIESKKIDIFEILEIINEKCLNEDFKFQTDGTFVLATKENIKKIQNEIKDKYSEDILINSKKILEKKYNDYFNDKNGNTKINKIIKELNEEVSKLEFELKIINNKKAFELEISNWEKCLLELIDEINNSTRKINEYFEKFILEWKINLHEIKNLYEFPKVYYKRNGENFDSLKSSSGEEKILKLIIYLLLNKFENKENLVIDDVFSSMDLNHIDEFISVINMVDFKMLIIFTHNFELYREISRKNYKFFSFWVLDKTMDDTICFEIKENNLFMIKDTIKINSFHNKNGDELLKKYEILFQFSVFREIIWNYIINKSNMGKDEVEYMMEWIRLIDNNVRHNRNNSSIKDIFQKIENIENNRIKNISNNKNFLISNLPQFRYIKKISENFKNEIIKNIVLDESVEKKSALDFLKMSDVEIISYIIYKNLLGYKIRFNFEQKYIFESGDQSMIKDWIKIKDEKTCRDFEQRYKIKEQWERQNLKSFNENFITHLNSFQWNRIIEMPTKKIQIALDKIKK